MTQSQYFLWSLDFLEHLSLRYLLVPVSVCSSESIYSASHWHTRSCQKNDLLLFLQVLYELFGSNMMRLPVRICNVQHNTFLHTLYCRVNRLWKFGRYLVIQWVYWAQGFFCVLEGLLSVLDFLHSLLHGFFALLFSSHEGFELLVNFSGPSKCLLDWTHDIRLV